MTRLRHVESSGGGSRAGDAIPYEGRVQIRWGSAGTTARPMADSRGVFCLMCGIVGYVGPQNAISILLDGLQRLEYRGYDSAGIAVLSDEGALQVTKRAGKLANLRSAIALAEPLGTMGIGHTRWATHGRPNDDNAHPHRDSHR